MTPRGRLSPVDLPGPPSGSTRGRRVLVGVAVLGTAAVLLLVTRAVLQPGVAGTARPVALPDPPAVGACVLLPDRTSDVTGQATVVGCDQPHDGEVTKIFPAHTPPNTNNAGATPYTVTSEAAFGPVRGRDWGICQAWTNAYIGLATAPGPLGLTFGTKESGDAHWSLNRPSGASTLIVGSPDDAYGPYTWSACVVVPAHSTDRYTGSVAGSGNTIDGPRPSTFMSCLGLPADGGSGLVPTSCASPHRAEAVAVDMDRENGLPPGEALQLCTWVAGGVTDAADPSYGGQLTISVEDVSARTSSAPSQDSAPTGVAQDCVLELAVPGSLAVSIVGLGDAPLPVTR